MFYVEWWDKVVEDVGFNIGNYASKELYEIVGEEEDSYKAFIKLLKKYKDKDNKGEIFDYLIRPEVYFNEEEIELLKEVKPFMQKGRDAIWKNLGYFNVLKCIKLLKIIKKYNLTSDRFNELHNITKEVNNLSRTLSRIKSNRLLMK